MTPEFKFGLTKALFAIAKVLHWITDVLSYFVALYLAFEVVVLAVNPFSTEKDYLRLATIAVILICVNLHRR